MSRQSRHRLLIDGDEYAWLVRNVERKARVVNQEPNKRLRAAFSGLQTKVEALAATPPLPGEPVVLGTNRVELRLMQELIKNTLEGLETTIIPGLEMDKVPSNPEQYTPRLEEAKRMATMLTGLLEKVRRTLA